MNSLKAPNSSHLELSDELEVWATDSGKTTFFKSPIRDLDKMVGPDAAPHMQTLVGVDDQRLAWPAIKLLGRLRFAGNRLTLAHVGALVTPPMMTEIPTSSAYPNPDYTRVQEGLDSHGEKVLREAAGLATSEGLGAGVRKINTVGRAAWTLMQLADEGEVQLLAIGGGEHGALQSFFLGSVGRALAIGAHESFLIARQEIRSPDKVRGVFATDHSDYADTAFSELLEMNPEGLGHITVVTTMEPNIERRMRDLNWCEGNPPYSSHQAHEAVQKVGAEMVAKIRATGRTGDFLLMNGEPIDGLKQAMVDTDADLMILGARGHSLVERVLAGSVALHMVVKEPFSLLVLRAPEDLS